MIYSKKYYDSFEKIIPQISNIELLKNKKILITGVTGMIGSAIVDFLLFLNNKQYNITIYAAGRSYEKFLSRFEINNNDLLKYIEYDSLKEINFDIDFDYIIYSSGIASPKDYSNHPVKTMNTSYLGLNNILKYCLTHACKKVIYVSSSEIYGINDKNSPLSENDYGFVDIINSRSSYPISRQACETLCSSYTSEFGINCSIVRLGHIYGPTMDANDERVSSLFIRLAHEKKDIVLKSSGSQVRSFCYVLDVVSAIIAVLINGKNVYPYNISNHNSNVSIKEFAECVARLSNVKIIYDLPTDNEKRSFNPMSNSTLDNKRLLDLEWNPIFSLDDGINDTLDALE